jgi:hypothetical protein
MQEKIEKRILDWNEKSKQRDNSLTNMNESKKTTANINNSDK